MARLGWTTWVIFRPPNFTTLVEQPTKNEQNRMNKSAPKVCKGKTGFRFVPTACTNSQPSLLKVKRTGKQQKNKRKKHTCLQWVGRERKGLRGCIERLYQEVEEVVAKRCPKRLCPKVVPRGCAQQVVPKRLCQQKMQTQDECIDSIPVGSKANQIGAKGLPKPPSHGDKRLVG